MDYFIGFIGAVALVVFLTSSVDGQIKRGNSNSSLVEATGDEDEPLTRAPHVRFLLVILYGFAFLWFIKALGYFVSAIGLLQIHTC